MTPWAYICIWQRPEAIMHIEAGHVDSNWPEFTFVFTYISCLNRLALSAISLKTNSLSYLILFIISLVSIYKREKALNQLLTYKQEIHFESNYQQFLLTSIIFFCNFDNYNAQTIDNQQKQSNQQVPPQSPVKRISTGQQYFIFFLQQQQQLSKFHLSRSRQTAMVQIDRTNRTKIHGQGYRIPRRRRRSRQQKNSSSFPDLSRATYACRRPQRQRHPTQTATPHR